MPEQIVLPRLVGSREAANEIVSRVGNVAGQAVILDCSGLVSGSVSFADELVHRLFDDKGIAKLEVVDADAEFWDYLTDSAKEIGARERVVQGSPGLLLSR
jgi:hypothetical protein